MNIATSIKIHSSAFTPQETKIANYLLDNLDDVHSYHLVSLAERIGVSKSSLLRFCQKLGYEGFAQFKYDITGQLLRGNQDNPDTMNYLENYIQCINEIESLNPKSNFDILYDYLVDANKIKIYGIHESGLSAKYLSYHLAKLGFDSEAIIHPNEFYEKAMFSKSRDLNIFLTLSGTSVEIIESHNQSINLGAKTVLITMNTISKIYKKANLKFHIPSFPTDKKIMFLDSQPIVLIVIDMIINQLAHKSK